MRLSKLLKEKNENETEQGTYAGIRFSQDDEDTIMDIVKKIGVPNSIEKSDIHLTLLYSRKYLPNYEPAPYTDMWAYPKEFEIFNGQDNKSILVLKVDSPDLVKRHKELMDEHKATYDYPEYIPHITLSYDTEDFMPLSDIKKRFTKILPKEFHIISEYMENLKLDWKENNNH